MIGRTNKIMINSVVIISILNIIQVIIMKKKEIKKVLGLVATATMLTACGVEASQDSPSNTASSSEAEASASATEATLEEQIIETKITVTYEQSATEAEELNIINDKPQNYSVKDYNRPIFFKYLSDLDYDFTYDEEIGSLLNDGNLISENLELVEDETSEGKEDTVVKPIIHAKDVVIANAIPVVKYLRTSDNEIEAKYISLVPSDSKLVSGITFVLTYNEKDEAYKISGMLGVFGENISGLETYEGEFEHYTNTEDGVEYCKPGDTITINSDISLFPQFSVNETALSANADGTCVEGQIEEIDKMTVIRIIHINHTKDGKTTIDYALSGLNTEKDTVKNTDGTNIDKETVTKQQTDDSQTDNDSNSNENGGKSDNGKGTGSESGNGGKSDNGGSKSGESSGSGSNGGGATNGSDGAANSDANKNQTGAQTQASESSQAGDLNDFANMFGVTPVNPDTTPGSWAGGAPDITGE